MFTYMSQFSHSQTDGDTHHPQQTWPAKGDLRLIAEHLDASGPPALSEDLTHDGASSETLMASTSPAPDSQSSDQPPPSLPPPPLPSPIRPPRPPRPIKAYCIPAYDQDGFGCVVNVTDAAAGESVLFRLQFQGDDKTTIVNLGPGQTMGGHLWIFTSRQLTDTPRFTGTVEYVGRSEQAWSFSYRDPTARFISTERVRGVRIPVVCNFLCRGHIEVRLGEDDVQLFQAIKMYY